MNTLGISGSPSSSSRSAWLVRYTLAQLDRANARVVEVSSLPARALLSADSGHPELQDALHALTRADFIIIGTPIYKAAYSGLLKVFLDLLPADGLRGKTVLPLATGGSLAHLLALDYALKPVLSALGARDILDSVFAVEAELARDAQGVYLPSYELRERITRVVTDATARRPSTVPHVRDAAPLPEGSALGNFFPQQGWLQARTGDVPA